MPPRQHIQVGKIALSISIVNDVRRLDCSSDVGNMS